MIYNYPIRKKKQSGETWVINESPELNPGHTYTISFISNNQPFTRIVFAESTRFNSLLYYDDVEVADGYGSSTYVFNDESYRTVTFLEPPPGDLLTWLQANAVKQ